MKQSHSVILVIIVIITCHAACMAQTPTPDADLNNDGFVDSRDLLLFQQRWHRGEQSPALTPTATYTPTPTAGPNEITINLPGGVTLEMVRIPAGTFVMGLNEPYWSSTSELPVHDVNIGYDFYMSKYEVTQSQWRAVMDSNPARYYGEGDNHPVYYVSRNNCQIFTDTLNQLEQGTFRLPSEAEWEYACHAGTTTAFYFGASDCSHSYNCLSCELDNYAWWCGNSDGETHEVGQKLPNAFGLLDMHGNVAEWCEDDWHGDADYEQNGAPIDGSAWVESPRRERGVVRGGDWTSTPTNCVSSYRTSFTHDTRIYNIGLRVVREVP